MLVSRKQIFNAVLHLLLKMMSELIMTSHPNGPCSVEVRKPRWMCPLLEIAVNRKHISQKSAFCTYNTTVSCPQIEVDSTACNTEFNGTPTSISRLLNNILLLFLLCWCTEQPYWILKLELLWTSTWEGVPVKSSYWELRIYNFQVQM